MRRHLVLSSRGALLISTDVHGSAGDFDRLEAIFAETRASEPETHWVRSNEVAEQGALEACAEVERREPARRLTKLERSIDQRAQLPSAYLPAAHFAPVS